MVMEFSERSTKIMTGIFLVFSVVSLKSDRVPGFFTVFCLLGFAFYCVIGVLFAYHKAKYERSQR